MSYDKKDLLKLLNKQKSINSNLSRRIDELDGTIDNLNTEFTEKKNNEMVETLKELKDEEKSSSKNLEEISEIEDLIDEKQIGSSSFSVIKESDPVKVLNPNKFCTGKGGGCGNPFCSNFEAADCLEATIMGFLNTHIIPPPFGGKALMIPGIATGIILLFIYLQYKKFMQK